MVDGHSQLSIPTSHNATLAHLVPQTFGVGLKPYPLQSPASSAGGAWPQSVFTVPSVRHVPQDRTPPQPSEVIPQADPFDRTLDSGTN